MTWLLFGLYVGFGVLWIGINLAYLVTVIPNAEAKVRKSMRHPRYWLGLGIGALLWPIGVLMMALPDLFPRVRGWAIRRLGRDYLDGERWWQSALADPPPPRPAAFPEMCAECGIPHWAEDRHWTRCAVCGCHVTPSGDCALSDKEYAEIARGYGPPP